VCQTYMKKQYTELEEKSNCNIITVKTKVTKQFVILM